jgi:hypothetical protein
MPFQPDPSKVVDPQGFRGPAVPRERFLNTLYEGLRTKAALSSFVLGIFGIALISVSFTELLPDSNGAALTFTIREVGAGLTVAALVTLALYLLVRRHEEQFGNTLTSFVKDDVTEELRRIEGKVTDQTTSLFQASASLDALRKCGVAHVYESRGDAADDIRDDLQRPGVVDVRLMGISLNDFVRSDQMEGLHRAWDLIASYVRGERTPSDGTRLRIRVLILDSNCFGAALRSFSETAEQQTESLAGRLENDVSVTADYLAGLARFAEAENGGSTRVSFDFRLYHLPPSFFICKADEACYVQPYYFWSRRDPDVSLPVMKLSEGSPLQPGIENHFDAIWDHASTPGREWVEASHAGAERGVHDTGVVNVFSDKDQARRRMLCRLRQAQSRVDLQGNSLQSFFSVGELLNELRTLIEGGSVRIRVLFLDPECEAAKRRSFRELALAQPGGKPPMTYDEYVKHPELHRESELYQQTRASLKRIREQLAPGASGFEVRISRSAPSCFMLRIDDRVFAEQYHLGKVVPRDARETGVVTLLGKDMPLVEFKRKPESLFDTRRFDDDEPELGTPFGLLENHFDFVFGYLSEPATEIPSLNGNGDDPAHTATAAAEAAN